LADAVAVTLADAVAIALAVAVAGAVVGLVGVVGHGHDGDAAGGLLTLDAGGVGRGGREGTAEGLVLCADQGEALLLG
ncbi:hypothetical protein OWR29_47955, partial [Actinoplanes sp. Pm04-4]